MEKFTIKPIAKIKSDFHDKFHIPRMGERAFILCPLADIFTDGSALGFDFGEKINSAEKSGVKKGYVFGNSSSKQ